MPIDLADNEFLGEGCLAGQSMRISTATAVSGCTLYRIEKALMVRMLHEQPGVAELFITHLLTRYTRFEEDVVEAPASLGRITPPRGRGHHDSIAAASARVGVNLGEGSPAGKQSLCVAASPRAMAATWPYRRRRGNWPRYRAQISPGARCSSKMFLTTIHNRL